MFCGGTRIRRRARFTVAQAAEQLHFDRDREILILQHRLWIGRMQHQPVVALRPGERRTGGWKLLADEAVLGRQHVVREWLLVEDVAELPVERRPPVVTDSYHAVIAPNRSVQFHPK